MNMAARKTNLLLMSMAVLSLLLTLTGCTESKPDFEKLVLESYKKNLSEQLSAGIVAINSCTIENAKEISTPVGNMFEINTSCEMENLQDFGKLTALAKTQLGYKGITKFQKGEISKVSRKFYVKKGRLGSGI